MLELVRGGPRMTFQWNGAASSTRQLWMNSASGVGLIIFKSRTRLTRFFLIPIRSELINKKQIDTGWLKKKSRNELIEPLLQLRKSASNLVPLLRGVEKKLTGDKWAPLQRNAKYKIHIVLYNYVTLNAASLW